LLVPGAKQANTAERVKRGLYKAVLERGFRAQLRTGNLLTSQLYVALDFFKEKEAEKVKLDWNTALPELPTVQGNFEELQVTLAHILKNLEKVQFDQIATDLQKTLKTLDSSLKGIDKLVANLDQTTGPELTQALKDLRVTLSKADKVLSEDSPMQQDVHDTLREVSRAAQSLRALTDMLDRQPEALLRGKQETKP
jgi:paraquat-inducible protein B